MTVEEAWAEFQAALRVCRELREYATEAEGLDEELRGVIYESIFVRGFRCFENLTEATFLAYLMGQKKIDGASVSFYVNPNYVAHARSLISPSNSRFIDWADVVAVRSRCRTYLEPDDPIYTGLTASSTVIIWMRKVRNHIAHNSSESAFHYGGVVNSILLTTPTDLPAPGIFLRMIPTKGPVKNREVLAYFLDGVETVGQACTGAP
jgi:hypothetical protein